MHHINIDKQIAFLRKQKGMTQEELAVALGVTNQSVSKWEGGQCCPDIQLLPRLAALFEVSVDELLGCKAAEGLGNIQLMIRRYFAELPGEDTVNSAYRIAALLHEIVLMDGLKASKFGKNGFEHSVSWKEGRDYATDDVENWGCSLYCDDAGNTGRKQNSLFFTLNKGQKMPATGQLMELCAFLGRINDLEVMKVLYALHALTVRGESTYASCREVASLARMSEEKTESALERLPVSVKETAEGVVYRLDDNMYHVPPLLTFFTV